MLDTHPRRFHLCMNVDGFLKNSVYPRDYRNVFRDDQGKTLEPAAARAQLEIEKAKGRHVIPMSKECGSPCQHADKGCTGFVYGGALEKQGCPGYRIAAEKPPAPTPTRTCLSCGSQTNTQGELPCGH
ncbi:hypothetical protein [Cupriavidus metallidurans]